MDYIVKQFMLEGKLYEYVYYDETGDEDEDNGGCGNCAFRNCERLCKAAPNCNTGEGEFFFEEVK